MEAKDEAFHFFYFVILFFQTEILHRDFISAIAKTLGKKSPNGLSKKILANP